MDGVEERDLKLEAVLLQQLKLLLLRSSCAGLKRGMLRGAMGAAHAGAIGAACEEVGTRACSSVRDCAGRLLVDILC